MALLSGHLTKLVAVNSILATIGESPVNSLNSGLGDAALAEAVLDLTSRELQLDGWHCNTRKMTLTADGAGRFGLPVNCLKVDTVRQGKRWDAVMRRKADNTGWILWDVENDSETWATPSTLEVIMVQLLEFDHLTPALQVYVYLAAGRRFQQGAMGSQVLQEIAERDVLRAETLAIQEDLENQDDNMLYDNAQTFQIIQRRNHIFGL